MNQKIIDRLEAMKKRYDQIGQHLQSEGIVTDIKKMTELLKEQSQLTEITQIYETYLKAMQKLIEAKQILNQEKDEEFLELAKEELKTAEIETAALAEALTLLLLPSDPNDTKNVIVEIRGAAGGDEGNIFAGDLYRMYLKYAEQQNWKVELLNVTEAEAGGFSNISFLVKGKKVYSKMKFESGAHRVQRIPKTESKGRVHTSTATVAVLPEAQEVDFEIKMSDLKIDTYRSSGAGGQHVNTTDSAVRITHMPTGFVVTSQDGRSQHDNKALAMQHLRSKLLQEQQRKLNEERGNLRKDAVGTGDRSEKIRTYNYPQNRVTDHRINFTLQKLDQVMEGNLEEIILALMNDEQRRKLEGE